MTSLSQAVIEHMRNYGIHVFQDDDGEIGLVDVDGDSYTADSKRKLEELGPIEAIGLRGAPIPIQDICDYRFLAQVNRIALTGKQYHNGYCEVINKIESVRVLSIPGTSINDDGLRTVGPLPHLVRLSVSKCDVSSEGFSQLGASTTLVQLFASETRVGDDLIAYLAQQPSLQHLHLESTAITDTLLYSLTCPAISSLSIGQNNISDKGVLSLTRFHKLQELSVSGTRVTADLLPSLVDFRALTVMYCSKTDLPQTAVNSVLRGRKPTVS